MTDRLVVKLKDPVIFLVYLNEFNMAVSAFTLQSSEAKVSGCMFMRKEFYIMQFLYNYFIFLILFPLRAGTKDF